MSDLTLLGFPRSTFVQIVGLVPTHKELPYTFRDLEPEMGSPVHLALHPFDRVPILQHGDFTLYETSAIVAYLEEVFPTPSLQPETAQKRARMHQWISAVKAARPDRLGPGTNAGSIGRCSRSKELRRYHAMIDIYGRRAAHRQPTAPWRCQSQRKFQRRD